MSLPVLLTVRGTLVPTSLDEARVLHNDTAGSQQGIAAARALGDLSHKVYAPCVRSNQSGAKAGELLFLDTWCDPMSIGTFFGDLSTQAAAGRMFKERDAAIWMRATGAYTYQLPPHRGKDNRFVGMIRAPIASPEAAVAIFAEVDVMQVRDARKRGIMSHELFIKIPLPGDPSGPELLGVDLWCDYDGMTEHYADKTHIAPLGKAFTGAPAVSIWEAAPGAWSEW